jgi:hypothetical protein
MVPPEEEVPQGPPVIDLLEEEVLSEEMEVPVPQTPSLSWSCRKKGYALSRSMTVAPLMKALYHPW